MRVKLAITVTLVCHECSITMMAQVKSVKVCEVLVLRAWGGVLEVSCSMCTEA